MASIISLANGKNQRRIAKILLLATIIKFVEFLYDVEDADDFILTFRGVHTMRKRFVLNDNINLRDQFSTLFLSRKGSEQYRKVERVLQTGVYSSSVNEKTLRYLFFHLLGDNDRISIGSFGSFKATFFASEHDAIKNEIRNLEAWDEIRSSPPIPLDVAYLLYRLAGIDYSLLREEKEELWTIVKDILDTSPEIRETLLLDKSRYDKVIKGFERWNQLKNNSNKRTGVLSSSTFYRWLSGISDRVTLQIPFSVNSVYIVLYIAATSILLLLLYHIISKPVVISLGLSQDRTRILLFDKAGKPINSIDAGVTLCDPLLVDINGEALVVSGSFDLSNLQLNSGYVTAFTIEGDTVWSRNMYDRSVLSPPDWPDDEQVPGSSGFFVIQWLDHAKFFNEDKEYVVVFAREPLFAYERISLLDLQSGLPVYSYWNIGRSNAFNMSLQDFNEDGSSEILLGAMQNELSRILCERLNIPVNSFFFGSALLLDPQERGDFCSIRMPGLPGCSANTIKWMVIGHEFSGTPIVRIDSTERTEGLAAAIINPLFDLTYYLGYDGNLLDTEIGDRMYEDYNLTAIPPLIKIHLTGDEFNGEFLTCPACDESVLDSIYSNQEMAVIRELVYGDPILR